MMLDKHIYGNHADDKFPKSKMTQIATIDMWLGDNDHDHDHDDNDDDNHNYNHNELRVEGIIEYHGWHPGTKLSVAPLRSYILVLFIWSHTILLDYYLIARLPIVVVVMWLW